MLPLEIKEFATWEESERWLRRHGYGMTQIEEIKAAWLAENAPVEIVAPAAPAKPAKAPVKE